MMENFLKTLKYEGVHLCEYETFEDVVARFSNFIKEVYDQKRPHSTLLATAHRMTLRNYCLFGRTMGYPAILS